VSMTRSVERLYVAFADVPKPNDIDYCPCCMNAEEINVLLSKCVNDLPCNVMSLYACNAIYTVGGPEDYHYLFPRLLELKAVDKEFWTDFEVILGKLKLAEWHLWPREQRDAVVSVVTECFETLLDDTDEFDSFDIEGIICGIARSGLPISNYLQKLEAPQYSNALKHFIVHGQGVTSDDDFLEGYWGDVPDAAKELVAWLSQQSSAPQDEAAK
jgi:hypothetical protein